MDSDLAQVITAISKNKSIKQLYMGRNTIGMKSKHIAAVMDALVQMLQEDDCVLQALHLPDSRLKGDLYNLINALGSNICLHTLDISGNQIGDPGARLLAKALQINSHLKTIIYDKNNIGLQGYADIVHALEKYGITINNFTPSTEQLQQHLSPDFLVLQKLQCEEHAIPNLRSSALHESLGGENRAAGEENSGTAAKKRYALQVQSRAGVPTSARISAQLHATNGRQAGGANARHYQSSGRGQLRCQQRHQLRHRAHSRCG